jgi:hypothetical protein
MCADLGKHEQLRRIGSMPDEDNVIDVESEEIVETDHLPAVIESDTHRRSAPMDDPRAGPRDWSTYGTPDRRCKAHKKNGEQCKNASVPGATVCRFHGGAAKHVKAAARARLENAADLMAKQLLGIALTAEGESVKLAAIRDALDRAGLKPPAEVVLSQGETKPYEELFEGIAGGSRAESRRARGVPDSDDSFAGVTRSTESSECLPPTQGDPDLPTQPDGQQLRREFRDPTTDARDFDRQRPPQPPQRHVTGDDAIRLANEANRQVGALPPLRELESSHKRYRRP